MNPLQLSFTWGLPPVDDPVGTSYLLLIEDYRTGAVGPGQRAYLAAVKRGIHGHPESSFLSTTLGGYLGSSITVAHLRLPPLEPPE